MARIPSMHLFELVKSMTASEKRHFKLANNLQKDSKYMLLFDKIDTMHEYEEDKLKKKLYDNVSSDEKKFIELKHYLYAQLLKSMQVYDEKTSVDYRIKNDLKNIRLLFKKALYKHCSEAIHKTKNIAKQYDEYNAIIELIKWEKQIAYATMDVKFFEQKFSSIIKEEEDAFAFLINLNGYRNLFFQIYTIIRTEAFARSESKRKELENVMHSELMKDEKAATSHQSKVLFFRIKNLFYYSVKDEINFYETGKKLIENLENRNYLIKNDPSEYIAVINNFMISCTALKKYNEMLITLQKLHEIPYNTKDDRVKIHLLYYLGMFSYITERGHFDQGLQLIEEHKKEAKQLDDKAFEKASFYFNYFNIYFGNGMYDDALNALNNWLQSPKTSERKDIQRISRMLYLMVHFELGNILLLESLLRSANRYLKQEALINESERVILGMFGELTLAKNQEEIKNIYIAYKNKINTISKNVNEQILLRYFDFESWIDSKIQNNTFAYFVQLKATNIIRDQT
jgi:hypothetical protein